MIAEKTDFVLYLTIENCRDTPNPFDNSDWKFISFKEARKNLISDEPIDKYTDITRDGRVPKIWLRSKLEARTALFLDVYDHSGMHWSLHGEGMQDRWDTSKKAGLLLWTGKPKDLASEKDKRYEYARNALETYNDWAQGNCYCYRIQKCESDKEFDETTAEEIDSCGGFIGEQDVIDAIKDAIKGMDHLPIHVQGEADWIVDYHPIR